MLAFSKSYPLISAIELKNSLGEKNIKVFDIRGNWGSSPTSSYDDYLEGHIPGAVFLDWTTHFLEPDVPVGLAPVASKVQAQKAFETLGISADDTVVLYDDYHHMLAGRIWWAMRYWGFQNVKVLNGGWHYWSAKSFPTTIEISRAGNGTFTVAEQPNLKVSLEEVRDRADNVCLVDARGPISYGGKASDPTTGHIPGAINLPYSWLLDAETNLFKDVKSLETIFDEKLKGMDEANIIASCGSGYAATVFLIALKMIGLDSRLFDGSFSIWKKRRNASHRTRTIPTRHLV